MSNKNLLGKFKPNQPYFSAFAAEILVVSSPMVC